MKRETILRKKRNQELVKRLKENAPDDDFNYNMDAVDTWWPIRPKIEKNKDALELLFKKEKSDDSNDSPDLMLIK